MSPAPDLARPRTPRQIQKPSTVAGAVFAIASAVYALMPSMVECEFAGRSAIVFSTPVNPPRIAAELVMETVPAVADESVSDPENHSSGRSSEISFSEARKSV